MWAERNKRKQIFEREGKGGREKRKGKEGEGKKALQNNNHDGNVVVAFSVRQRCVD
jgi:hypothetical protein